MALDAAKEKYIPKENNFYRDYYHYFFYLMTAMFAFLLLAVMFVLYQIANRPLPEFAAKQPDGKTMELISFNEPNLLPDTIIRFASKAAVTAYSFDFVNYDQELSEVRPFFTSAGWSDFNASISNVIGTVVQNQLFVSGVVSGPPVISNQGLLPDTGYTWRVQVPFLVTYQSANTQSQRKYYVILTIVRVPTSINPQGIGIDQFVMR
ncbi:MAG TPA: DotI/IcmL family type IV secretion protein [Gammaproteobacteria bacterium]|jgi:intracellular multiplication protein IcmL|nr:DotI/IcmL family type IV secretion protein [Gammaproteobacteria bacterium]